MKLTKKQKKHIKTNYPKLSIQEISKKYHLKEEYILVYLKSNDLYQKTSGKEYSKKWFEKADFYLPLLIFVLAVIIGVYCFTTNLNVTGDNVDFMHLGNSIAEGNGMGGHTKYPFGYPLLLAIVQILFNKGIFAQKILSLILYIFSAVFMFLIFKRYIGEKWAFFVTFLSICNPIIIELSHQVMSDIPYLFFSLLAIYLFIRFKDEPLNSWRLYGAIIAAVAVYYVRGNGFVLIGAVISYYLIKKEWKRGLVITGCFIVLMLPWILRGMMIAKATGSTGYLGLLLLKNAYHPEWGYLDIAGFFDRIMSNLEVYLLIEVSNGVIPYYFNTAVIKGAILSYYYGIIIVGISLSGLVWAIKDRQYILSLYAIFFLIVLIIWPAFGRGERHIMPIIPIFIYFSAYFLYKLYRIALNKINIRLVYGFFWSVAFLLLLINIKNINTFGKVMKDYPPDWGNYFKAAEWSRDNTPEESIFSDRKPGLFKTVSLRECTGFAYSDDRKEVINSLYDYKVDYVVLPSTPWGQIFRHLYPAVKEYKDRFKAVFFIDNPPTYILKFDRSKGKIE